MAAIVWQGDKLWYLLNEPLPILRRIFPDYSYNTLKSKRREWTIKLNNGEIEMPPQPRNYEQGATPEQKRASLDAVAQGSGHVATSQLIDVQMRQVLHDRLDEVLDETNINPEMVKGFKVSSWDMGYKDSDGEAQTQRLHGIQLIAEAKDFEPKWPVVQPAQEQITLPEIKVNREKRKSEVWLTLPDNQIHYWQNEEGDVFPFHDLEVHALALQIMADHKKDIHGVVNLGDFLDAPTFSVKYTQTPTFAMTMNRAVQFGHNYLAYQRKLMGNKQIHLLMGNHPQRLDRYGKDNARAAWSVRQANENWPALSEPFLLRTDDLKIDYLDGYTDAGYGLWVTDDLVFSHAPIKRQHFQEKVNNVHGHTHHRYHESQTLNTREGGFIRFSASPGTMSRIDGYVPSTNGVLSSKGMPIKRVENWQQGLGWVEIDRDSGAVRYTQIEIDTFHGYRTLFNGKTYTPDKELVEEMRTWDRRF
jgi:hypothetical protein